MTRDEWAAALRPDIHWSTAYPIVAREARAFLASEPDTARWTTAGLVDAIHPWDGGAIKRIYKALPILAIRELADCCTRGMPKDTRFKTTSRPWVWHSPGVPNVEAIIPPTPHARLEAELLAYVASHGSEAAKAVIARVLGA